MSTIVDRALPDVRDGLKPSQRRILVAMHDLNLTPGRKHSKCAGIVGETMKRYHPHGDGAIYPTLVNMGQDWKTRALLVDKQGNFGSVDPDPPAAMRYTEARLHPHAMELLNDLKLDTVDYRDNFDGEYQEPVVLPAKLPNLLINGSTGIAVGMACSMPPHNLGEVCDGAIATIDNPDIGLRELMDIIPGPDFPSGGILCGRAGVYQAYMTGRGRAVLRARIHTEDTGKKQRLVITELPYQVSKNDSVVQKIVALKRAGKLDDISNIVDESSNRSGMRVVIELKKGTDPAVVENQLYQMTPLQNTFSIINIALVDGQPRTLNLRELIQCHIDHRVEVIRRRTAYLLHKARTDAHRLEGLIFAVCDIDEVIRLIRESSTRDEAIDKLMQRGFRIAADHPHAPKIPARLLEQVQDSDAWLTRVQAESIGRLQLIQLVGLEIDKLVSEYSKLVEQIMEYETILADAQIVFDMIKADLTEMKAKYVTSKNGGERRTEISDAEVGNIDIADLIPEHQVALTLSYQGYVKRLPVTEYRTQNRGGKGAIGAKTAEDDYTDLVISCSSHDDLLCFTHTGRCFKISAYQIPEATKNSKGRAMINILNLQEDERICAILPVTEFENSTDNLLFATEKGLVKRTTLKEYANVNRSGIRALNLKDGDHLVRVLQTSGEDHILMGTRNGMAIRFSEDDARIMGRTASGVRGINLGEEDKVIDIVSLHQDAKGLLLTVTEKGYGKRTCTDEYLVQGENGNRPQGRGGKGRRDLRVTEKNGPVTAIRLVEANEDLLLLTVNGVALRTPAESVRQTRRDSQGVKILDVRDGDRIAAVARIEQSDEPEIEASDEGISEA